MQEEKPKVRSTFCFVSAVFAAVQLSPRGHRQHRFLSSPLTRGCGVWPQEKKKGRLHKRRRRSAAVEEAADSDDDLVRTTAQRRTRNHIAIMTHGQDDERTRPPVEHSRLASEEHFLPKSDSDTICANGCAGLGSG